LASSGCKDVGIRKFEFAAKIKAPEVFTDSGNPCRALFE